MSCLFVLMPVVAVGGWPVMCAAAVAAAGAIGYRKVACGAQVSKEAAMTEVEVEMDKSMIAEGMAEDEKVTMERDGIQVEFYKDPRGRLSVHVRGKGIERAKLKAAGEELIGRVRQQFAYQRIMDELEKRGYQTRKEEVGEDRRIRIRLERIS